MTKIRKEQFVDPLPKDLSITAQSQGTVLYFDGTNWVTLQPNNDGYVLTTHNVNNNPTWSPGGQSILSNSNPANIDNNAAFAGVGTLASRFDHKHNINVASAVSVGTTNAQGSATTLALSDHTHAVVDLNITGQTTGDILYFNGSNWVKLSAGQDGYFLTTHTNSSAPNLSGGIPLTNSLPTDTNKSSALVGVSGFASRADHKHNILTAQAINIGASNSEGTATTIARSDHTHQVADLNIASQAQGDILYFNGVNWVRLPASTDGYFLTTHNSGNNPTWTGSAPLTNSLPTDVDKSSAIVGVSGFSARADHKHNILTASAVSSGTANAEGTAITLARSDHTHATTGLNITGQAQGDILYFNATSWVRLPASTDGYFLTTHSTGQNPTWAGGTPLTNSLPADSDKSTALVGVSGFAARADHKHNILTGIPVNSGATNAEGTATTLARSDHTHATTNLNITSQAQGDLIYYNGTSWTRLAAGSDG